MEVVVGELGRLSEDADADAVVGGDFGGGGFEIDDLLECSGDLAAALVAAGRERSAFGRLHRWRRMIVDRRFPFSYFDFSGYGKNRGN